MLARKRGRPKKTRILLKDGNLMLIKELTRLMDKDIYDEYRFRSPLKIKSRKNSSELTINDVLFEQETKRLKEIWELLNPNDAGDNINFFDQIDTQDAIFDKFDEDDLLQDQCFTDYMDTKVNKYQEVKPPIQCFIKEAFDALPTIAQNTLKQNHDNLFNSNKNYQEQIYTTLDLIFCDSIKCSMSSIGSLFGIQKGAIANHLKRKSKIKSNHGRPNTLTEEQFRIVLQYIKDSYDANDYREIEDIAEFIYLSFDISIQYDTLYRLIIHSKFTKIADATIMESVRADIPLETIRMHYARLKSVLETYQIPPEFVFNIDEIGFIDFIDMKKRHVVVPEYAPEKLVLSVNRATKRVTMIGGIALDGTKLRPLIILPNKRIDKELIQNGYGQRNALYCYQENGFINSSIFDHWAQTIFIPEIQRRRDETGYTGIVLLLLDGCSSHFSDFFLDEATYNGIYTFQEPPGSSDQVLALDLGIFGIQKHFKSRIRVNGQFSDQSRNIMQIINSWIQATTPDKVVSAFNQAGIYVQELPGGSSITMADIDKARAVRGMNHSHCKNEFIGRKTVNIEQF